MVTPKTPPDASCAEHAAASKLRNPLLLFPPWTLMAAAFAIMTAGVVGEADAMFAPYQGDASGGFGITVLLATLFLLLAVVAGPLLAFNMVLGDWTAERVRRAVDGRAASPETGKTDTEG